MNLKTADLFVSVSLAATVMLGCAHTQTEHPAMGTAGRIAEPTLVNRHVAHDSGLNARDAKQLQPAWQIDTPVNVSHQPLVQNGRVYFADWGGTVFAANARNGKVIWQQHVETPQEMWPWHGFAGTGALGEGKLFEVSVEGDAYALDQSSGDTIWHVKISKDPQTGNLSTLLYHDGLVYVGLESVDEPMAMMMTKKMGMPYQPRSRGGVIALDANTGNVAWKRYTVGEGENGAAVWTSFALDPQADALFFTTGNNYSGPSTDLSDSIIAVNAHTGQILWHFQAVKNDIWTPAHPKGPDWDFAGGPQLFEADGRQLVGAGSKDGTYYVLDRRSGQLVWKRQIAKGGVGGGIRDDAAFSNGRLYLWSNDAYDDLKPIDPAAKPITVACLDASNGNVIWQKKTAQPAAGMSSGVLANNVYFVGSLDGTINGYRASDGKVVWTSKVHKGSIASAITIAGDTLMVGTGVPTKFNGQEGRKGIRAFTLPEGQRPMADAR